MVWEESDDNTQGLITKMVEVARASLLKFKRVPKMTKKSALNYIFKIFTLNKHFLRRFA